MKQVTTFSNGVKFEATDKGFSLIAKTGEVTNFDKEGRIIKSEKVDLMEIAKNNGYFFHMGAYEREVVSNWLDSVTSDVITRREFIWNVKEAFDYISYDYNISAVEPSIVGGRLEFNEGKNVLRGITVAEWEELAKNYNPEKSSRLADIHELLLWYAYRVAIGAWDIAYVCDTKSFYEEELEMALALSQIQKTGAKIVGGFADGTDNTSKIVRWDGNSHCYLGGRYKGHGGIISPAQKAASYVDNNSRYNYASGVIVTF